MAIILLIAGCCMYLEACLDCKDMQGEEHMAFLSAWLALRAFTHLSAVCAVDVFITRFQRSGIFYRGTLLCQERYLHMVLKMEEDTGSHLAGFDCSLV